LETVQPRAEAQARLPALGAEVQVQVDSSVGAAVVNEEMEISSNELNAGFVFLIICLVLFSFKILVTKS